jgi:hypothetical protein
MGGEKGDREAGRFYPVYQASVGKTARNRRNLNFPMKGGGGKMAKVG